jgi:ketosteroid isomerase-like protein
MSQNKQTVERYIDGFNRLDHAQILDCVTEDVVWDLPGAFHLVGKAAFEKEIENPGFKGRPVITLTRMIEEHDVVSAEGTVRTQKVSGEFVNLAFCDIFVMRQGKISHLISYLMEVK